MRKLPLLMLMMALLLSACGGSAAPAESPAATPSTTAAPIVATSAPTNTPLPSPTPLTIGGTLTIRHSWGEGELPILVQIIDGFRQQYPEVYFDVLYVPAEDLQTRYETEFSEGRAPLLLLGPAEWGPQLYGKQMIADLTGLIDDTVLQSLNQPALQAARQGEALVGLPYGMQGVVLYRNQDIITINPTTLEELTTLAQTTTQGNVIGAYLERSLLYAGAHLNGLGGKLVDENGQPAFADPKGLDWIALLRSFELAGPPDYNSDDDLVKFKAGSAGWIIDGTWNLRSIAAELGPENVVIDAWPATNDGKLSGYVFPDMLYLNAQADAQQRLTAQTFMQYFVSIEAQSILAQSTRIPANSGAKAQDPALGTLVGQAMTALAGGTPYPTGVNMTVYNQNLDIALRSIFDDNANPEDALNNAAQAIRDELQQTR